MKPFNVYIWTLLLAIGTATHAKEPVAILDADDHYVNNVLWCDEFLLTSSGPCVRVWNPASGAFVENLFRKDVTLESVVLCGDYLLISSRNDGSIEVFNFRERKLHDKVLGTDGIIASCSASAGLVVWGAPKSNLRVYRLVKGTPQEVAELGSSERLVLGARLLTPDGKRFIAIDDLRRMLVWDLSAVGDKPKVIECAVINGGNEKVALGAVNTYPSLSCDSRGRLLAVAGREMNLEMRKQPVKGKVDIWDLHDLTYVRTLHVHDTGFVSCATFSNDGRILAVGGDGGYPVDLSRPVARAERFAIRLFSIVFPPWSSSVMRHPSHPRLPVTLVLLLPLLLACLYVGSYLAVTDRGPLYLVGYEMSARVYTEGNGYRHAGRTVERFFAPLRAVDRRVRPKYWSPHVEPGTEYLVKRPSGRVQPFLYPSD